MSFHLLVYIYIYIYTHVLFLYKHTTYVIVRTHYMMLSSLMVRTNIMYIYGVILLTEQVFMPTTVNNNHLNGCQLIVRNSFGSLFNSL